MAHARRFRFGAEMQRPFEGLSWADSARELEALGYSTLFVPDHFHEGYGPITAMATAAMATTTLKVGPLVFDCDFRHPAVLARELASIDMLSEGRLEIGLGAGWKQLDYTRSGIPMDPPRVRVDRMIEHTLVLKGLFADEPLTFAGEHYQIGELDGTPKPYRPGGPPIIIAGGGRRVMRFAGATADIVGVNASIHSGVADAAAGRDALPASIDQKISWLRDGAGDRFDELEINAWLSVAEITNDAMSIAERLSSRFGAEPADVLASPLILVGSEAEIVDHLHARRERWGYSYYVVQGHKVHEFASIAARLTGA
ncbi:MAG: TIGR03621 family F420-dependent LLM class oxidoreductase [Acidimicrobiales bacterium]